MAQAPDDAGASVTPEIAAEAAVWVARLHGPDRSRQMELECLAWQGRSATNRVAFERCTDTWEDVARISLRSYASAAAATRESAETKERPQPVRSVRWRLAAALVLGVLGAGTLFILRPWANIDSYATGVGEQRTVVLDDGSRMSLNTSTRVRVKLAKTQRTVSIQRGEALFEVAKDVHRPFVVLAAGSEVVAVGTVFSVRFTPEIPHDNEPLEVTLIEGRVIVQPQTDSSENGAATAGTLVLQPGDRVRLGEVVDASKNGARRVVSQLDRPRIEQVTAWKRDEAVFDDVSLADAVAEMNRYSRIPIVLVGDEALASCRVSGLFRTGDNASFARAVASLHGLTVHERQARLELTKR